MKNISLLLLSLILISSISRAAEDTSFDALTSAGFAQIRAAAAKAGNVPAINTPPTALAGGVYLHSWIKGQLFYCSQAGCAQLKASGAGVVLASGQDGVYFTGQDGTGYCGRAGCKTLLHGQQVTFTAIPGPSGDVWTANAEGAWHCRPTSCRQAFSGPVQTDGNYLDSVYKADGDFVADTSRGIFWCSGDSCRQISGQQLVLVEENCAGTPPEAAVYGFWGPQLTRCSPQGCRVILSDDKNVDNYVDCSFDQAQRLHLPMRGADRSVVPGSLACAEDGCVADAQPAVKRDETPMLFPKDGDDWNRPGKDGAKYSLVDLRMSAEQGQAGAEQPPVVRRSDASGTKELSFNAPVSCWQWWTADDDDEVGPAWVENCRLLR